MSRVTSLGLHTPAALPYCITEGLLPDHPASNSYTWSHGLPHEELLVTSTAVVWSQGGVIRRVFRYDVEKEPVVQAVLTWFPSEEPQDTHPTIPIVQSEEDGEGGGYVSGGSEGGNKRKQDWSSDGVKSKKRVSTWNSKNRTYATQLGSFPKVRATEAGPVSAGAAEQPSADDEDEEGEKMGRARALVVFLKTQAFVYFLSGTSHVIHLPFEIQHAVPAPRGLLLQRKPPTLAPPPPSFSTGNSFSFRPTVNAPRDSPRIFSLTDPLVEVGLVINPSNAPPLEDLVFISPSSEFSSIDRDDAANSKRPANNPDVIFSVTYNAERSQITVWQARYIPQEPPTNNNRRHSSVSGTQSRRRSSFGLTTGATTPVTGGGPGSIASTTTLVGNKPRDSLGPADADSLKGLGEDFETGGKRTSRRVSSLVARADLSGNHDAGGRFSDVSTSMGASFVAPPAPQNSMLLDDQPVDELLNELNMGALGIGMDDLGSYDGEGLRNEVLMSKIESFSFRLSSKATSKPELLPRVFTLHAPSSVIAAAAMGKEAPGRKMVMFVVNKEEGSLLQLTFQVQIHSAIPKGYSRRSSRFGGAVGMGYTPVLADTQERKDVLDAVKMEDGGIEKVLILTVDGKLSLYSPWGGTMDIFLPPSLTRWNPNSVGEDGSRRGSRKKGFARSLSTNPDIYRGLEHPDPGGRVTVIDGDGVGHRISITMIPKENMVKSCLETLRTVLGASVSVPMAEGILAAWMEVVKWLHVKDNPEAPLSASPSDRNKRAIPAQEWKALVVTLFALVVPFVPAPKPVAKRRSGFSRSVSMIADKEWEDLVGEEGEWGSTPEYFRKPSWKWMAEEADERATQQQFTARSRSSIGGVGDGKKSNRLITDSIELAREFCHAPIGDVASTEYFGRGSNPEEARRTSFAVSLVALHLLREEWKLDIAMEGATRRLCAILRQMAGWLGWSKWVEEYMLEDIEMVGWAFNESRITGVGVDVPPEPAHPDIYVWLMGCLKSGHQSPFMMLQDIVTSQNLSPATSQTPAASYRTRNPFSPPPPPPPVPSQKSIFQKLTPRTKAITEVYRTLSLPGSTDVDVVSKMVELRMTVPSLQRLPEGIAVPLREAIARCQEQPPTTWGVQALDLVGRKDLKMLMEPSKGRREPGTKWQSAPTHEAMRDVHVICNSTFEIENIGSYDHMAEHDRQAVSRLLFKDDRRIYEAARLLQSNKPVMAKCIPEPHWNEQEMVEAFKEVAGHVAMRTLAVSPGRGLFNFSARIPLLTEKFPISGFNLNCVVKPVGTTHSADKSAYTEEKVCWAFFHAGVAAGVSISREAKEIDTSWIVFNKPPELTNRHAGFLLGLGLNGHLKSIAKYDAFNYLTPKHTMTSIGLLLGLSASYLGTMDATVTKLLSVHVTRLLPPGSAELNLSSLIQTGGIMGIGLLYANTQHRRMSEVMLSEIEHVGTQDSCVPSDTLRDEGYRLAAGFALGFINLGSGKDLRGLHDMHLVERLLGLAVGSKKVSAVHILDKATAGATVALGLIYLKTNDESLARKIDVPDTIHLLDYVRPDIFLLRTVARNLIMWSQIKGTFAWIHQRLRPFHRPHYKLDKVFELQSEELPFYNIVAGLCFSIALKYAGSANEPVRDLLLHYLDQFIRLCNLPALNHDQKLARTTIRNCQDLLALSAATVMAGTGDIAVFRRLRKLHGRIEADMSYGSHLAAHLAIGVLFLGNGSYTFGTENIAIAALFCAFYPLFPTAPLDNKAHLQAFRHFWPLAVEARCVVPRDVETFRPTSVPINIVLRSGQEFSRIAPCLLPRLDSIATVTTVSPMHWTVVLDFVNNERHRRGFEESQSIFVKTRSAHASQSTVFQQSLLALDETENLKAPLEWVVGLPAFSRLDKAERALVSRGEGGECVDERLELEGALRGGRRDRLRGVGIVVLGEKGGLWVGEEVVEGLRAGVWVGGGS